MGRTTAAVTAFLQHVFQNANWANIGDTTGLRGSSTPGVFWLSLHTADPGRTGNQTTNEAAYPGYTRISVARSAGQWTVSGNQVTNAVVQAFPVCTSSTETELYWGLGTDSAGAGNLEWSGLLTTEFLGFTAETTGDISVPSATFVGDDPLCFFKVSPDWPFPTGITESAVYYVLTAVGDVFTVSDSVGGSPITISAAGAGAVAKVAPFAVSTDVVPTISASSMVIIEY